MSSSFLSEANENAALAPAAFPLLAAQIALTMRPDWPDAMEGRSGLAALAEDVAEQLRLAPEASIGLGAVPPAPEEPWQRNAPPESLLPATTGLALSDLIWFG
jgi:hypothetical protein